MEFILVSFFLTIAFIIMYLLNLLMRRYSTGEKQVKKRIDDFSAKDRQISENQFVVRDEHLSQIPLLNKILKKLQIAKKLSTLLEQADMSIKVGTLILIMIIFSSFGLLTTIRSRNLLLMVLAAFSTGILPLLYVNVRRARRIKSFIREFPDALDMMISALKAGHSFNMAMQLVASEAPDPVGIEFRKTYEENSLGLPLKEALLNLTERVQSLDLKLFVTAVLLQKETGGNLTEILHKISHTIRERFKLMGQMKVYTAQGRFSMWILGMLPVGFALLMQLINPGYLAPLFEEKSGHVLLIFALSLQIIGFLVIRKIVTIKYQ